MRDFLLEFMQITGNKKEFNLFLDLFKKVPKSKFAIIKISGTTLEKHMDLVAQSIAFLNKLSIYPIVVHGAGSELDKRIPNSEKVDGIRITKKEDIKIVSEVFHEISDTLIQKINDFGGSAKNAGNIFECLKIEKYGFVGDIKSIDIKKVEEIINENKTPIISPIGIDKDVILNINADTATKEIIKEVDPYKVILITETGGILDSDGNIISFLNPSNLEDIPNITGGMLLKVKEISELVENNKDSSVVITSAQNLLKEMFTVKGSGTFIKSYTIHSTNNIEDLDKNKLKELLEGTFHKKLVEDYFDGGIEEVIFEKNYEGVAIIKKIMGLPYLDKLAVSKHRQETGLGGCIWNEVIKKYPSLTWRVVPSNPFNNFYLKKCTGCIKFNNWNVYWTNIPHNEALGVAEKIEKLPKTLI